MPAPDNRFLLGFLLGGCTFVAASYILHCRFGMGPWPCQDRHPRFGPPAHVFVPKR